MSIEKTIHYCWFGNGNLSDLENKCIKTWKEKLPDYKIQKWDETNFPINKFEYTKQAYEAKKYAFVSDYARAWVLYNYGGIYLDTDYEIIRNIDQFLNYKSFMGVENELYVGTAIMGSEKGNWIFNEILHHYDNSKFLLKNGILNMIPNTLLLTDILEKHGYVRGKPKDVDCIHIAKREVFYPNNSDLQNENFGKHYFRGSWWSEKERKRSKNVFYKHIFHPILLFGKKVIRIFFGTNKLMNMEIFIKNILK